MFANPAFDFNIWRILIAVTEYCGSFFKLTP